MNRQQNFYLHKILLLFNALLFVDGCFGWSSFYGPQGSINELHKLVNPRAFCYSINHVGITLYAAPPKKKKKTYYRKPTPAAQRNTVTPLNQGIYGRTLDSLEFYEEEEYTLPGMLPEYDFYAYWDTLHVDAYRFSLKNLTEEVPLVLVESDCKFAMPMYGRTNSTYGWRHGRPHTGIDLQLSIGDSVFCAFDGVVRMSRYYQGYGYCVVVRHYNGLETLYAHLSKLLVTPGTLINAGQCVGLGGSTGHSTGPHLHFETRFLGRPLNPSHVINFSEYSIATDTLYVSQQSYQLPYSKTTVKSRYKKKRSYYKRSSRKSSYRRRR